MNHKSPEWWDMFFLGMAKYTSQASKDPSTKVGAVIANGKHLVSVGFNGFPEGVDDDPELLLNKEYKYSVIIHGEINAILATNSILLGTCLYTFPFMPCSRCASIIIQKGIKRIVSVKNDNPRWGADQISMDNFKKAGVELVIYDELIELSEFDKHTKI
jgi:dCMP deaminase